jgi:hypothetical protein
MASAFLEWEAEFPPAPARLKNSHYDAEVSNLLGYGVMPIGKQRKQLFAKRYGVTFQNRAGLRGGPAGQLPGALRRHWNKRKYGASRLRCPHAAPDITGMCEFGAQIP